MRRQYGRLYAGVVCLASAAAPAQPPTASGFTYQGLLEQSGAPVDGTADFEFMLFGGPTGGTIVGPALARSGVPLVNGAFTVTLDFGSAPFNGDARWLEITMRSPAGTGNFVTLTPRQRIAPAPYAHRAAGLDGHSLNAADGDPVDALVVSNTGDVGIGVTPFAKLSVSSGNGGLVRVDNLHGDLHVSPGTGVGGVAGIYNDSTGVDARTDLIVDAWPRMVINGGGGVGIGTLSPLRRLHVAGDNLWTARLQSTATTYTGVEFHNKASLETWSLAVMGTAQGGNAGALYVMRPGLPPTVYFATNDWVGLEKIPGFRLDLPNIANAEGRARANQWVTFSSARWKDNVHTLDGALDKVMRLRGVSFDWKPEHGGAPDVGFVAEEVGRVAPELVTWEEDGQSAEGLAYDRITALAVEAIKEQQRRIDRLRRGNAELREQIDTLRGLAAARAPR